MSLGPNRLRHAGTRSILKRKRFRKVLREFAIQKIEWSHASLAPVKSQLRLVLRAEQHNRCVFCRRILKNERRNAYEDIEHFLDKSKPGYRKWTFCCLNVTLACHACNLEKGTRDLGAQGTALLLGYPMGLAAYKWIHPYFDDFHENIEIGKGWTYTVRATAPAPARAQQLIEDLKLSHVEQIERYAQEIKDKIERFTVLATKCIQRGQRNRGLRLLKASMALQNETTFG